MNEWIAFVIVITPIALLFIAFWRSPNERERRVNKGFYRSLNETLANDYRADEEPDVPKWIARVHYEQMRTMGSGNGHWSENE